MKNTNPVFIQVIHKPERKVICKRGVKAEDNFPYCEDVGCNVWGLLLSMDSLCGRLPDVSGRALCSELTASMNTFIMAVRCVLYRGEDTVLENGIEYRNAEEYLKSL